MSAPSIRTPATSKIAELLEGATPIDPARAAQLVARLASAIDAARLAPGAAIPARLVRDAHGALGVRAAANGIDPAVGRARFGPPPGEPLDERSDVYALGVVLFVLLTGRFPLGGTNPVEWALAHRQQFPVAPSKLGAAAPPDLDALVLACLAKTPAARPASRAALAARLEALADAIGSGAIASVAVGLRARPLDAPTSRPVLSSGRPPAARVARMRPAATLTAVVAAVAAVAAGGFALVWRSETRPEPREVAIAARPAARQQAPAEVPAEAPLPAQTQPAAPPVAPLSEPPPQQQPARVAGASQAAPTAAQPKEPPARAPRREPPGSRTPAARPAPAPGAAVAPPLEVAEEAAPAGPVDAGAVLARARSLLARKRFLAPPGDNALELYRTVLDADPRHAEAAAQVRLIRDTYHELASTKQASGDLDGARELLRALAHGLPGDLEVGGWLAAVEAERSERDRKGTITVAVRPWGAVFLDGRYVDETALSSALEVTPGRHTVLVRGRDNQTRTVEVEVRGGEAKHVPVDLTDESAG